jgi:cytochrome c oxidase cbb3-type subunit 1
MEPYVRRFIRSSLVWLAVGVSLGLWMAVAPSAVIYRPAHMHANLLGFVSMMIFGVAYHVLPRFVGTPLRSGQAATAHLWFANGGLALMTASWLLRASAPEFARTGLAVGGVSSAIGAFLFIGNIWLTLGGRTPQPLSRPVPIKRA